MQLETSLWYEFTNAVERGPLVYALKIESEEKVKITNDIYKQFTEVFSKEPWNFRLLQK